MTDEHADAASGETVRVDRWLWAVRLVKTRSDAARACRGGRVRINDRPAKPASPVRAGDRIDAYLAGRQRIVDVTRVLSKRVGAPLALESYDDHSPPPPPRESTAPPFVRDPGSGRPTKKERRQLDRLRGRRR